jgi:uncharacterized membrane-anchored protein YitT (DUF2179 family)
MCLLTISVMHVSWGALIIINNNYYYSFLACVIIIKVIAEFERKHNMCVPTYDT